MRKERGGVGAWEPGFRVQALYQNLSSTYFVVMVRKGSLEHVHKGCSCQRQVFPFLEVDRKRKDP